MAGSRKFSLKHMARTDIAALTHEAVDISGIPYVMNVDRDEVETILGV
jgi:hypothetical protein